MIPFAIIPGSLLTGSLATYYTMPANNPGVKQIVMTGMRFLNSDSVNRTVTVNVVPPGGTASLANTRFKTLTIPPASAGNPPPFFIMDDVLVAGSSIQAQADAPNVVVLSANGMTYP